MCGCVNKNSLEKETFKAKTIKVNCFTFCFLNNNCAALHCAKVEAWLFAYVQCYKTKATLILLKLHFIRVNSWAEMMGKGKEIVFNLLNLFHLQHLIASSVNQRQV